MHNGASELRASRERISNMLRRCVSCSCRIGVHVRWLPDAAIRPGLCRSRARCCTRARPATGAVVYFQRQGEPGTPRELVPFGIVQDDGGFSLSSERPWKRGLARILRGPGRVEGWNRQRRGPCERQGANEPGETKSHPLGAGPAQGPLLRCEQAAVASGGQTRTKPARSRSSSRTDGRDN